MRAKMGEETGCRKEALGKAVCVCVCVCARAHAHTCRGCVYVCVRACVFKSQRMRGEAGRREAGEGDRPRRVFWGR